MVKKRKRKTVQDKLSAFKDRLQLIVDPSLYLKIEPTFVERPTTFRVNTIKAKKHDVLDELKQYGFKAKNVLWSDVAFILQNKSKREFMMLDCYKKGHVYIQSLASMVPPIVMDPQPGEKVLDLTAAPGSKTSQIAALMDMKGELIANDKNKVRFFKLQHNMEALGVLTDEAPDWEFTLRMEHGAALSSEYEGYFDKILLDAPCSAESRFIETQPKTYSYWRESKIKETAYVQRKLLYAAWQALKPGGELVYSTCTFAPEENELQVSKFLDRFDDVEVMKIDLPHLKKIPCVKKWKTKDIRPEVQDCLRILPTKEIEGFFVVRFKKSL